MDKMGFESRLLPLRQGTIPVFDLRIGRGVQDYEGGVESHQLLVDYPREILTCKISNQVEVRKPFEPRDAPGFGHEVLENLVKHSHVPLPQVAGELGLIDRFTVLEDLPEARIRIQACDHVMEGFRVFEGHTEESQELRASFIVFLVLIGVKRLNGAI